MSVPTSTYEMDGLSTPVQNVQQAAYDLSFIKGLADYNSAQSAAQAQIQRDWQEQQNAKAMQFNKVEAAKNRNWQEYMSNTAHQREIADLKAAGLNPVLSAMNGNGASVGSGATASGVTSSGAKGDIDTSASMAMVNLLGTIMDNQNKLQLQTMSAVNNLAVAEKYTETSRIVQDMINSNQRYLAEHYPSNPWQALGTVGVTELVSQLINDPSKRQGGIDAVSSAVDNAKKSASDYFSSARQEHTAVQEGVKESSLKSAIGAISKWFNKTFKG